jgi:hypothetical protein
VAVERLRTAEARRARGEAGRRAVRERYNWEQDTGRLLAMIDRVAAAGARRGR